MMLAAPETVLLAAATAALASTKPYAAQVASSRRHALGAGALVTLASMALLMARSPPGPPKAYGSNPPESVRLTMRMMCSAIPGSSACNMRIGAAIACANAFSSAPLWRSGAGSARLMTAVYDDATTPSTTMSPCSVIGAKRPSRYTRSVAVTVDVHPAAAHVPSSAAEPALSLVPLATRIVMPTRTSAARTYASSAMAR
mmetsp:Transcript_706/g.1847  ORF Transcript_706/g.1847 Transcript_706/m.1847 type:complete len:200 (-) Transcript_706:92-691(-)